MKQNYNKQLKILITGSTGGLGNSFVKSFCHDDNHLILTSTSKEKLEKLIDKIKTINKNVKTTPIVCNFLDNKSIINLVNYLKENNIQLDYLINNAGFITEGSIENAKEDTIINCIKVNCIGTTQLTKNILDLHDNSLVLKIITIASMAGDYPMPYMAVYSSTKAYLKNFMLALGYEYKNKNVKSLVVQPGAIATSNEMKEAIKAQGLKGRLSAVSPDVIAKKSIQKCNKGKKTYTPGFFNQITKYLSLLAPTNLKMKAIGSMWRKSQEKRNIK